MEKRYVSDASDAERSYRALDNMEGILKGVIAACEASGKGALPETYGALLNIRDKREAMEGKFTDMDTQVMDASSFKKYV